MSGNSKKQSEKTNKLASGTIETKKYYDKEGWRKLKDGRLSDNVRWWEREHGPLRTMSHQIHILRISETLAQAGDSLNLLECGCGGNPELNLLDLSNHYTGVDFSSTGLEVADEKLRSQGVPYKLIEADACSLPFADESFDAVFSAHMVYHIRDPKGQATAFREMLRVTRKGGIVVLILANPRPLLFPGRLVQRLISDTPILGHVLYKLRNKFRHTTPIPYNPRPIAWMRRQLKPFGQVEIIGAKMASQWFNQHITEKQLHGRLAWKALLWLEREHPKACARLGNYVQISIRKNS